MGRYRAQVDKVANQSDISPKSQSSPEENLRNAWEPQSTGMNGDKYPGSWRSKSAIWLEEKDGRRKVANGGSFRKQKRFEVIAWTNVVLVGWSQEPRGGGFNWLTFVTFWWHSTLIPCISCGSLRTGHKASFWKYFPRISWASQKIKIMFHVFPVLLRILPRSSEFFQVREPI